MGVQGVVTILLNVTHFETNLDRMPADNLSEDFVDAKRVEDEVSGNKNFAAKINDTIVERQVSEIVLWLARGFEQLRRLRIRGNDDRNVTAVSGV